MGTESSVKTGSREEIRHRIMAAAFAVLMERGYARASTLEIATQAKVSKRELYTLFGDKRGVLLAMVSARAARMRQPLALPERLTRDTLAATLTAFGTTFLKEVCDPTVSALFRVAISEAERDPEMAHLLDENGRQPNRAALVAFLAEARKADLMGTADPEAAAGLFLSLLFGDVPLRLVMRSIEAPSAKECARRAERATAALLALYPATSGA